MAMVSTVFCVHNKEGCVNEVGFVMATIVNDPSGEDLFLLKMGEIIVLMGLYISPSRLFEHNV
jgi:hypothetical protein